MMNLNSSLGDAARDDRLAGDAFIAGRFGSILARAPLLWPRIVYDPRMRLYDSEFPVASWRALPPPPEQARARASETHSNAASPAGTLSVSLIPTCVAYIRKR